MTERLYLVVRGDLAPGDQAVQAAHALRAFVEEHPDVDRAWFRSSNTLALLSIESEERLHALFEKAVTKGLAGSRFHEPDMGDALTAIALEPRSRSLLRSLPLALQR